MFPFRIFKFNLKFNTTALMQDHTTLRSVVPGSPKYYIIFCTFIAIFFLQINPQICTFFPYFKALCAGYMLYFYM